jgi:hypothetical protein
MKALASKTDLTNELLTTLVNLNTTPVPNDLETEDEKMEMVSQSIQAREDELRAEYLFLRLTERQRNVLINLLTFRREKGKTFSGSIEELFFYAFKEVFFDSMWNTKQPGFDQEFKEAFAEFFESKKPEA